MSHISEETDTPTVVTTTKPTPTSTNQPSTTIAWETETLNEGQAIQKALQYLLQHRDADWGWGNDTHHVMLTLQVGGNFRWNRVPRDLPVFFKKRKYKGVNPSHGQSI